MNIAIILETRYADCEWSLAGNSYVGLVWHDQVTPKPNESELEEMWASEEFQNELNNQEIIENRRKSILSEWPIHEQFEALTEAQMGRPEKLDQLINYIKSTKEQNPKI